MTDRLSMTWDELVSDYAERRKENSMNDWTLDAAAERSRRTISVRIDEYLTELVRDIEKDRAELISLLYRTRLFLRDACACPNACYCGLAGIKRQLGMIP